MAEQPHAQAAERPLPESRPAPAEIAQVEVAMAEVREFAPEVMAAPQIEAPRRPEPAPQIEAPRIDPKEYLQSAGLQMVETRSGISPASEPAEEPVQLGRPRRERPRTAAEESLVQVETHK
jgi:hypothetical protein